MNGRPVRERSLKVWGFSDLAQTAQKQTNTQDSKKLTILGVAAAEESSCDKRVIKSLKNLSRKSLMRRWPSDGRGMAGERFYGEFDPGSELTLAACLTHASRAGSGRASRSQRQTGE